MQEITVSLWNEDYSVETEVSFPAKFEVCPRCEGKGHHTNPSIDGNGITSSEMAELGHEFMSDYMSGVYDVTCYECGGKRVIEVIDQDAADPAKLAVFIEQKERAEIEAYQDLQTQRAECGYCW